MSAIGGNGGNGSNGFSIHDPPALHVDVHQPTDGAAGAAGSSFTVNFAGGNFAIITGADSHGIFAGSLGGNGGAGGSAGAIVANGGDGGRGGNGGTVVVVSSSAITTIGDAAMAPAVSMRRAETAGRAAPAGPSTSPMLVAA